jgi:hypothetical protein
MAAASVLPVLMRAPSAAAFATRAAPSTLFRLLCGGDVSGLVELRAFFLPRRSTPEADIAAH